MSIQILANSVFSLCKTRYQSEGTGKTSHLAFQYSANAFAVIAIIGIVPAGIKRTRRRIPGMSRPAVCFISDYYFFLLQKIQQLRIRIWDHVMLLQTQIQCITALYHRVYRCFYGSHITGKDHDTFSADALAKAYSAKTHRRLFCHHIRRIKRRYHH